MAGVFISACAQRAAKADINVVKYKSFILKLFGKFGKISRIKTNKIFIEAAWKNDIMFCLICAADYPRRGVNYKYIAV